MRCLPKTLYVCLGLQEDLEAQPQVWAAAHMEANIPAARRTIYNILAGRVAAAPTSLGLDWRRTLGLYLWHGTGATATLDQVRLGLGRVRGQGVQGVCDV